MVSAQAIRAAIVALGTCFSERNDSRLADHLDRISIAVSLEARDDAEAAALLVIARSEAAFSIRVQAAPTHSGALSDFQIEARPGRFAGPLVGLELEPIQNATRAALWYWRHSFACGPTIRDRFSAYHGVAFCGRDWPTLDTRVKRFAYARSVLWRETRAT